MSQSNVISASTMSCDEIEGKRSIVVSGIPESFAPVASSRVLHDVARLRQLFDFLHIYCQPFCLQRMSRFLTGRPRLLKVVLSSSFYASLILRIAPTLKAFPVRGIFVRPSLSKSEKGTIKG